MAVDSLLHDTGQPLRPSLPVASVIPARENLQFALRFPADGRRFNRSRAGLPYCEASSWAMVFRVFSSCEMSMGFVR